MTASARLSVKESDGRTIFVLSGKLDAEGAGALWRQGIRAAIHARQQKLVLDVSAVPFSDVGGATFLAAIESAHGEPVELIGAGDEVTALLGRARAAGGSTARPQSAPAPSVREVIATGLGLIATSVSFIGEAVVAVIRLPARRRMLRLPDLLLYADQAGLRSMPLILMLGFLIGLILAFQSAVPMRRYGADVFVANLVAISLLRELGPLLAAVILAGRTGSAFAAEIGTMKVNEEIDALKTMGLDPMTMLVLPRVIAAMLVMPAMTLALEVAGLLGMTAVMRGFGFPLVTVARQVQDWVGVSDLLGGLFKALWFGMAVAAIGCRAGLTTGVGPRAVGLSTTAAVVGGIVATILLDGAFALIFYRLGL